MLCHGYTASELWTKGRIHVSCGLVVISLWHPGPFLSSQPHHQNTFFMGQKKDSFGSHLHVVKGCYNYANCTPNGVREYSFLLGALGEYFAFTSTRLCQHSVSPRMINTSSVSQNYIWRETGIFL